MKSLPVDLLEEAPPRVLIAPRGARANSWEDVADLSARAGVVLDLWQERILETSMGERADATWAAKRVGVTVPRQNGKSQLLVSRALAGALLFGEKKIVISAHQQDTARESFSKMMEIVEADSNGWLRERVKSVMNALNRESIKFVNGATIQFKARSGAGGKGFSSDCLMLDEAQILGARAWTSINSTMSAMPNPQVWLLGTAPQEEDDSETFEAVRSAAIEGKSTTSAWCEWGADRNSAEFKAALPDLIARRWSPAVEYLCWSANPAWASRMNVEVVQGECETYSPLKFGQDRLGLWPENGSSARRWSSDFWASAETDTPPAEGVRSFSVAFSQDGSRLSLAGAVKHDDGVHVELVDAFQGSMSTGVAPLADWLTERWRDVAMIAICGAAGAALKAALKDRGVGDRAVRVMSTADYFAANTMTEDAIRDQTVTHPVGKPGDLLDVSVSVSDAKKRGTNGQWGWEATVPDGDETPVEAFCAAYWAARTSKRVPGRKAKVSY